MAVEFKDYYKTLGVAKDATQDQIKKAFRKLSLKYHPDKAKGDPKAEDKFKEINEAYEVLGDPEKRKKYETLGSQWNQPGGYRTHPGWAPQGEWTSGGGRGRPGGGIEFEFGGTGFSDFFEQFFGGGRRGGFSGSGGGREDGGDGRPTDFAQRGSDIEGDIMVTLHEALQGSSRDVSVRRVNPQTRHSETQTYRVKIPAGVHEGQLIRLAGRGHEGHGGGASGDLYLRVKFAKHPDFRARDSDLYYDLVLAPWEAVLGTQVTISALDGAVALKIPPGTISGRHFRIRGKGLPQKGGGRGDLYAVVTIQVPADVTARERQLWEQVASESRFNPRST